MEEIDFGRLMELGGRHLSDGDPDGAVHYYNSAIRREPAASAAWLGLAQAFSLKAGKGETVFRVLALDALRKAVTADPSSEEAHWRLAGAAAKADKLGDLAVEYREKLKRDPGNEGLKKRLKHIYIISLLDREVKLPAVGYKPALFLKVCFDCVLLPLGASIIVAANVFPRARPSLMIGVSFFVCYAVYRSLIFFFSRR
ncbi:MAG: tetratricopeptide repeat protein [Elusimicrobiota bacterium]